MTCELITWPACEAIDEARLCDVPDESTRSMRRDWRNWCSDASREEMMECRPEVEAYDEGVHGSSMPRSITLRGVSGPSEVPEETDRPERVASRVIERVCAAFETAPCRE